MLENLTNKKIILGVTGSIAVFKAVELVRLLVKHGASVKVVMTKSALAFIQPLTFATLSRHPVYTEMFHQDIKPNIEHIELAKWADAILIAPASANIIAKLAQGIADDLLSTICLAANKTPLLIAPAMNKEMWSNNITQTNIRLLLERGVKFFGPEVGVQACGDVGDGRMLEASDLLELTNNAFLEPLFKGKKIVITAGPTVEYIDPVRFITNKSSGKMGYAIAQAALDYGAQVILISGPTNLPVPIKATTIMVKTASQMFDAVMQEVKDANIFIATAAVADYRPETISQTKIKRTKETLNLKLVPNPDILATVAALPDAPITVGFAAETENLLNNARHKLTTKGVEIIAANLIGENVGFDAEKNSLELFTKRGEQIKLAEQNKSVLAYDLMTFIFSYLSSVKG